MNPFKQALPAKVYLRNRARATVEQFVGDEGFCLLGRFDNAAATPDSWRIDGRWQESGAPHPFDIIAEIVDDPGGGEMLLSFANAAGKKGGTA